MYVCLIVCFNVSTRRTAGRFEIQIAIADGVFSACTALCMLKEIEIDLRYEMIGRSGHMQMEITRALESINCCVEI